MDRIIEGSEKLIYYIDIGLLPGLLKDLVDLIGIDNAFLLTHHYGGQLKYIAKSPHRTAMRQHLNGEALEKICYQYGGLTLEVPKNDHFQKQIRNTHIMHALASGKSRAQVAQEFSLGVRQVGNIKRALNAGKANNYYAITPPFSMSR